MIVPVIEHMEKEINSTTLATKSSSTPTNARLLNRSDDLSSNLIFDENKTTSSLNKSSLEHKENLTSLPITSCPANNKQPLIDQVENCSKKLRKESSINQNSPDDELTCQSASNSIVDFNNNLKNQSERNDAINSHQQTIIIEGGINTLQFQLKPEIVPSNYPDRQITLKLVPVGPSNQLNETSNALKSSEIIGNSHFEQIQLESTDNFDLVSHDFKDTKNCKLNTVPIQTVKLAESNQNVYFMMQPIDLISNNLHSNSIKLKSPPHSVSSTTQNYNSQNLSTITLQNLGNANSLSSNNPKTTTVTLGSPVSSTTSTNSGPKVLRDERRRANHNEVERRRRDNINKWIVELSKVIPDCCNDQSKHGQSKGGILEKTVQFLLDMKKQNQNLYDKIRSLENLQAENELLKEKLEEFKKENQLLKIKIQSDSAEDQYL